MDNTIEHIHEFNSFNTATLSIELMRAIESVIVKYGLTTKVERNKFSPQVMQITYELLATDTHGKLGKQAEFEKFASVVGLKPEHYGKMINLQGKLYRISGIRPSATKNSVCIESARGKTFVCNPRTVLTNLVA